MDVSYRLMNPSGNVTVLVETPVPREDWPQVAMYLLEKEPLAEQVGFLSSGANGIRLDMAGGEFCGNATMSAAVCYAMQNDLSAGHVPVEVSGEADVMVVDLEAQADGSYKTSVQMPQPLSVIREVLPTLESSCEPGSQPTALTVPVVRFDGIAHVILEQPAPDGDSRAAAEESIHRLCDALQVEALGLQFFDRAANRLTPLVYVPAVGSTYWESACGSGTAAVGVYLASETGAPVDLTLEQPGGTLRIEASPDGTLRMTGTVTCMN